MNRHATIFLIPIVRVERTPGTPQPEEIKWNKDLPDEPNDERDTVHNKSNAAHISAVFQETHYNKQDKHLWNKSQEQHPTPQ